MLTLCRTLMGDPQLIMIDEPTEGLAPKIVELVAKYLQELKNRGVAVLLVEQKLTIALEISERCYVMGHGSIVFEGTPAELKRRTPTFARSGWRSSAAAVALVTRGTRRRARRPRSLESNDRSISTRPPHEVRHECHLRSPRRGRRDHAGQPARQRPGLRHAASASPPAWHRGAGRRGRQGDRRHRRRQGLLRRRRHPRVRLAQGDRRAQPAERDPRWRPAPSRWSPRCTASHGRRAGARARLPLPRRGARARRSRCPR